MAARAFRRCYLPFAAVLVIALGGVALAGEKHRDAKGLPRLESPVRRGFEIAFGKMTDLDLRAVYEYLSAIPHAEPAP